MRHGREKQGERGRPTSSGNKRQWYHDYDQHYYHYDHDYD